MIEGSSWRERKFSLRTLIELRVLTSRRTSVLSKKPWRFPATAGLWYVEEDESTDCTIKIINDASHREGHGNTRGEDLGIFLVWRAGGLVCAKKLKSGKKSSTKQTLLPRSSMAVLYLGLIDLDLSSCLAVSPPRPSEYFWELHARAHAPSQPFPLWEQELVGGEKTVPPL